MKATALVKSTPNYDTMRGLSEEQFRKGQKELLEQVGETPKAELLPADYLPFLRIDAFTPEYEMYVRHLTNPYGQHNSAYDPEEFAKMPPQDSLTKVWGWFHGTTGFSCMFRWASGRQDAFCVLDLPNPSDEAKAKRAAEIKAFKPAIDKFSKELQHG